MPALVECFERMQFSDVSTFVASGNVIFRAAAGPRSEDALAKAQAVNVIFLARPLNTEQSAKLELLRSPVDDFVVAGSEMFWLCRLKQSRSQFSNAVLERLLRVRATLRTLGTVQRLAAALAAADGRASN
jgi:uncharacterized protein (DUF1697 family)